MFSHKLFQGSLLTLAIFAIANIQAAAESADAVPAKIPEPTTFVSDHSGRFNGQRIDYRVTAGETYLRELDGAPKASIFSFSYRKNNLQTDEVRPVTFIWNGGPGSSSTLLHMGSFGPNRVGVPTDASHAGTAPYPIIEAPATILDVTDLVFIDPVGTGFSRALGDHEGKEFWGLKEDAKSMAEFIRTWLTDNGAWNSPRFLLGESFGTTRAAAVANLLEGEMSISLNGIIFVSQALDYQGSTPYVRDNLIFHITYLPTMAATALYHNKIQPRPANQQDFLQQARRFATDELLPALFTGTAITSSEPDHIRDRLAYFTGLSPEYIERARLRVQGWRFAKELLRDQGLAVGLLDARYTEDEIDDLGAAPARDAASDAISSAFKAALMDYMHSDLGIAWNRLYLDPADPDLNDNWRWRTTDDDAAWEPMFVNTARDLASALRINPGLNVFVAAGYFDLVTPFFDAEYTLNRHDINADRVQLKYYQG